MTPTGAQATTVVNGIAASRYLRDEGAPTTRPNGSPEPGKTAAQLSRVTCQCLGCGKSFQVGPWELKRGRGKYCSLSCAGKGGNTVKHDKPPTVQLGTLEPGTKFRIETTEAEVVRQSPASRATVVKFIRDSKTTVLSTWLASVRVRVLP